MFLKKKFKKWIAVFFLLTTLNYIVAPGIALALTSGPTAPEANSFEPVDTTDMVNLNTGDFTYNVPLLEIPGPAGGYPLSLSYHAGIQLNQDASWVGLGWNLNPGAITRTVSGFPDDHKASVGNDHVYWEGGETEITTVGLSYGIGNFATVSAGISVGNDRYRGYGVGGYVGGGVGLPLSANSSLGRLNMSTNIGVSPWGDPSASAGIGVGITRAYQSGLALSSSIGLSFNSRSGLNAGLSGGVSWGQQNARGETIGGSLLGANIGTGSSKPSLSLGGGTSFAHNQNSNKISSFSRGFNVDIPVYFGINVQLGYSYQRYWLDESLNLQANGSLYFPKVKLEPDNLDLSAYDVYDILDTQIDMAENSDASKVLGGSFPDYDQYFVSGQGISGNIRPYHYQQTLYRQNIKNGDTYQIKNYPLETTEKKVGFRFVNDFSNRMEYDAPDFSSSTEEPLSFSFDGNLVTGEDGNEGYNQVKNQLAGSKHVEWFTNGQILGEDEDLNPVDLGFLYPNATGFARESNDQIGGFMITNESGVTYHYNLPVYSYDEYLKSENTQEFKEEKGDTYNEISRPDKYAYTWLLTAVTGPDFVDKNNNHFADPGDYGYWVEFEYGKWTDDFLWRNPLIGKHKDLDGEFENFSSGKKELYYLDAIRTASHTALFVKKIRNDGKSATDKATGGSNPSVKLGENPNVKFPTSVLGLEEILLVKNEDLKDINFRNLKSRGDKSDFDFDFAFSYETKIGNKTYQVDNIINYNVNHFGDNVLDYSDIQDYSYIRNNALRAIKLETDYSLCKNTPNSLKNDKLYTTPSTVETDGKLTLKKLYFLGKGGVSLLPPLVFNYEKNPQYKLDFYDMWGFYKNDFKPDLKDKLNENIGRRTSSVSSNYVDAWSLTSITTPTGAGIEIEYESDSYEDVVLAHQQSFRLKKVEDMNDGAKLKLYLLEDGLDFESILSGNTIDVNLIGSFLIDKNVEKKSYPVNCSACQSVSDGFDAKGFESKNISHFEYDKDENFIVIDNQDFYNKLKVETKKTIVEVDCGNCIISYSGDEAWPDYIQAGVISVNENEKPGGGVRVKSISVTSSLDNFVKHSTLYDYGTGVTSYEPFVLLSPYIDPEYKEVSIRDHKINPIGTKIEFKKAILKRFYNIVGVSRELPGPGVMYQSVTIRERIGDYLIPNRTVYEFQTFTPDMFEIDYDDVKKYDQDGNEFGIQFKNTLARKLTIKDYTSFVGSLKSTTLYDDSDKALSKTENHYLNNRLVNNPEKKYSEIIDDEFNGQGLVEETFSNARFVKYGFREINPYPSRQEGDVFFESEYRLLGIVSKREKYPSVLTGQTNTNYKTGVINTSKNLAFDFYSGAAIKTLSYDSYGNYYVDESVPAYREYPAMGSKVYSSSNKNMLTQTAATYSYKVDPDDFDKKLGLTDASIQTWSDLVDVLGEGSQPGIWRKHSSWFWDGEGINDDGTYKIVDFEAHPFDFENLGVNASWEKSGELTLYDVYSHGLEATDINGNYAATRTDPSQFRVIANASNASYSEMAYSGAEYYTQSTLKEGGVDVGDGVTSFARSHTGKVSLKVPSNKTGFVRTLSKANDPGIDLNKKFKANVWVYVTGDGETEDQIDGVQLYYKLDGQTFEVHPTVNKNKSKNWYRLEVVADPAGANEIEIGCRNLTQRPVYFDDFRVAPLEASMNAYVYDPDTGELTYILDTDNFYTKFEYDPMGRLVRTSAELLNYDFGDGKESYKADRIVSETVYNYGKQNQN